MSLAARVVVSYAGATVTEKRPVSMERMAPAQRPNFWEKNCPTSVFTDLRLWFGRGLRGFRLLTALLWFACGAVAAGADLAAPIRLHMNDEFVGFNYGKEHGLPDDDVRDVLQSRDGCLWILTQQGIARFDGTKYTVFDRANNPEFQSDDPRMLMEDRQGNLWVGGKNMLLRLSGHSWRRFNVPGSERIGSAFQMCADAEAGIWVAGDSAVAHVADQTVAVFGVEQGLNTGGHVTALQVDATGALLVGTLNGVFRLDQKRQEFALADPFPRSDTNRIVATALRTDHAGRTWGTFAQYDFAKSACYPVAGIHVWQAQEWMTSAVLNAVSFPITDNAIHVISEDRQGNFWITGPESQVYRVRQGQLESLNLLFHLKPDVVTCVREDHEGSLWMGTMNSGLWRWHPRRTRSISTADGLPHENAWAVCEGKDGQVWVGTDGGLARIGGGDLRVWKKEQGLSRSNIRALAVDRDDTVWIGTGEGLNSLRDGIVTKHPIPGDWFESKIRVILPTRDGALWVAGAASLHRLAEGQRTRFTTAEGLANNDVRALLEDSAGRLWIGTFGGGLQCYDQGRFTSYATTNGLANGFVWALHQDKDGDLWIGTESGLYRLRESHIARFGKAQGLPDNLVNFILEDDFGQLWISHDRGIYRVRRAALKDVAEGRAAMVSCVSYTEADGLPSEETNGQKSYPPACKTRDGRLWFATTKGVVVIDPQLHQEGSIPPPVVIEVMRATGELVFSSNPQDPLSPEPTISKTGSAETAGGFVSPAAISGDFQLPPGSGRVIEFGYTANTFVDADRARFKYRLIGLDDRWIDAGARRQAFFTNLKPGRYRFQVMAANHHGVWNETGATCAFQIRPFYYESWWFYFLCGSLGTLVIAGFIVWRLRELQKLNRLERQAAVATERSRIAQDLHDGLGADLTRLSALADLASDGESVTSREQLRKLAQHSRAASRGLKDLIWIANPANDTLESFLDRLCQNAQDYLRDTGIACRFDLATDLPPLPLALEQRRNLLLVVREALNNVVKHSAATQVLIALARRDGELELSIRDNGRGYEPGSIRDGTMGLSGMRRRMEQLGGAFAAEGRPGVGTWVRLKLKWNNRDHEQSPEQHSRGDH